MGCYGIGTTRILGTVVEALHDKDGVIWPKEIASFHIHLVSLLNGGAEQTPGEELFKFLERVGADVLFDDHEFDANVTVR